MSIHKNMKKVISKGYTITVTSWENDGDNYRTKSITVDSKELAEAIRDLCKTVFISCDNGEGGIGNSCGDEKARGIIIEYMKNHPELYKDKKIEDDDDLIDICMEYNDELMGSSDFYFSRVMECCDIVYSPDDINLETI